MGGWRERERERGQIRQQRRTESISCSAAGGVIGGVRYGHWLQGTTISVHLCLSNSLSLSLPCSLYLNFSLPLFLFHYLIHFLSHFCTSLSLSVSLKHTLCLYLLRLHDLNTSPTVDPPPPSLIVSHDDTNKP